MGGNYGNHWRSNFRDEDVPSASPLTQELDDPRATPLRLFIVSDVRLVREGLLRSINRRRDIIAVGSADFSKSELEAIVDVRPDVCAVDLASNEGLAVAQILRSLDPRIKLFAFSVSEVERNVFACAAAGFSGYVTREAGVSNLVRAAHDAVSGRLTCTPKMAAAMFSQLAHVVNLPGADDASSELTAREQQILSLLCQGQSNKEIGRELRISPSTVKNHIHSVLQKLKVQRRGQAAALIRA